MKLIPLSDVRAQLRSNAPLPWNVRDANGKLLLARGFMMTTDEMVSTLLERGVFIDADEARAGASARAEPEPAARVATVEERWSALQARLARLLRDPAEPAFLEEMRKVIGLIVSLTERNVDQIIYLIIRHDHNRFATYGISHSLHVATVCSLLARRMDWPRERHERLVGAALTMNLGMIELQGRLAGNGQPLTPDQRKAIDAHPTTGHEMLKATGLDDEEWLTAVLQHHEQPDGKGYPTGTTEPSEMSQILRFVDQFTAKHAWRADRGSVPAQQAARELYTQSAGHPVAALLIKEFGIFPPGCYVKLASGETAIVIRRGAGANTPLAAALTNRSGDALGTPMRRDTAQPEYAITATLTNKSVHVQVRAEQLYGIRGEM